MTVFGITLLRLPTVRKARKGVEQGSRCFYPHTRTQMFSRYALGFFVAIFFCLCDASVAPGSPQRVEQYFEHTASDDSSKQHASNYYHKRQSGPAQQYIRIGTTEIQYGPFIGWGALHNNLWQLYLEKQLTYTLGGKTYGIELISYIDDQFGSYAGGNTSIALVERLVLVDKVHLLITSYEGNTIAAFIPTAERLGVPCINVGSFEYAFYPPGLFQWTVNMMPDLATLGYACGLPLVEAGAKNFSLVRPQIDVTLDVFTFLVVSQLKRAGLNFTGQILNVTTEDLNNNATFPALFAQLEAVNPDVVMFDFRQADNIRFIDQMRRNNYNPRAYYVWGTGSYPEVRSALGWKDADALISEAYSPYLEAPDPLWTGTSAYEQLYLGRFNVSTSFADATLAAALTILDAALKSPAMQASGDLSPASLRAALLSVNISTLVGPISFTNGAVNRELYCLQNSYPNATAIDTVWPKEAVSYTPIRYPAKVNYPPKYFESLRPKKDTRIRNILLGVLVPVGALLLIFGLALLYLKMRYHTILISKAEFNAGNEEWAKS